MPGSRITRKQEEIYMRSRQTGQSQDVAAAKNRYVPADGLSGVSAFMLRAHGVPGRTH